jgi:hypothetical protein
VAAADIIRVLLLVDIIGLAVLALIYLRRRRLDLWTALAWGLLAVLVPILGPFLVIAFRPAPSKEPLRTQRKI